MRILFCNIARMDYYKGIVPGKDEPKNGGSYVKDTKDAHEKYNFKPELLKLKGFPEGEYCLGFVETKSTSAGKRNQLNIEKIEGCSDLKNDTEVDDVLVVYCALYPDSFDEEIINAKKNIIIKIQEAFLTSGISDELFKVKDVPLHEIGFSVRVENALRRSGINSLK